MVKKQIDLKGVPDVIYISEMLKKFSGLLDTLNNLDDVIKTALPKEAIEIIHEMNVRDYPRMLASHRVSLKRWHRGYGEKVWGMINELIDCSDDVEVIV